MQNNGTIEKFCQGDNAANCDIYGGLYQWDELMQYVSTPGVRGICPPNGGWHLPSDAEWCMLELFVDPTTVCTNTGWRGSDGGGKLKETGTSHWTAPNTGATNSSGFTSLGGGLRDVSGNLYDLMNGGYYWSSTLNDPGVISRRQFYNTAGLGRFNNGKTNGFSVRCLKNLTNQPPSPPSDPNPLNTSTGQAINPALSWTCTDPESDPLVYDVYFGTAIPPALVATAQAGTTYDPGILSYGTTYHWKVIARDDHYNTIEGDTWSFSTKAGFECGDLLVDIRDNQTYPTVVIGEQCWMAKNLNVGTMVPGTVEMTDNGIIEKYCYNDVADSCAIYGGLYKWDEAMQYQLTPGAQGICPPTGGWHVPTDLEWCTLEQAVDPTITCSSTGWRGTDCGGKLKETGYRHWLPPNTGATNATGFTAIPGGLRNGDGSFLNLGANAYMWTSDKDGNNIWSRFPGRNTAQMNRYSALSYYGFILRCVRDLPNWPPASPSTPQPADGAADVQVNALLGWACSDPEGDPLTFDIFFGTTNPPPQVSAGLADTTYDPGALAYGSTYFWKIVAHDDHGNATDGPTWSFGTKAAFACGDPMADYRDHKTYATVLIGNQCWMAENLNIGTMIPGPAIMQDNGVVEKYCYGNSAASCELFGGLYQWGEMMQYATTPGARGICPEGWHVPGDLEWCLLEQAVDPTISCDSTGFRGTDGGTKLKAGGGSGFNAFMAGFREPYGSFVFLGYTADFFTSLQSGSSAWIREVNVNNVKVYRGTAVKDYGFGVRCLNDVPNQPPLPPSGPQPPDGAPNQPMGIGLSWTCVEPEYDPLTFDVYLGVTNPPPLVMSGQPGNTFIPTSLLIFDTTFYWKIVAHDDHNHTIEGPVWSFGTMSEPHFLQCGDTLVDIRDGQKYGTILIGNQCWMTENLNLGTMVQGNTNMTNNGITEKYCYGNLIANCDTFGGLYQWNEMMQYITAPGAPGICPAGWYIPRDEEWCVLEQEVDPTVICDTTDWRGTDGGVKLKQGGSSGFEALMGGMRISSFHYLHSSGLFWTSTRNGSFNWSRKLEISEPGIYRGNINMGYGLSVRCLLNTNQPPAQPSSPQPSDGATNLPVYNTLSWTCSDPENDPLSYDVYFGTTNPPGLVSTGQSSMNFNTDLLQFGTVYYWKIIARDSYFNATGGPVWSFIVMPEPVFNQCGDILVDSRNGELYPTVQIGDQCWMAKNLNIGTLLAGSQNMADDGVISKYCYNNLESNCDSLGGLYQWNEMMQYVSTPGARGICPENWHLPADGDWCALEQALDSTVSCNITGMRGIDAGTSLKQGGASGFEALMAGFRSSTGYFSSIGGATRFWSSSLELTNAWYRYLSASSAQAGRDSQSIYSGYSVRCMFYTTNTPPHVPANPSPPDGAVNQSLVTPITWTCMDPEYDPLTYDVYFGNSNPPPQVVSGQTQTLYQPDTLDYYTTYYWKIVAHDDCGHATEGPLWSFTTVMGSVWQCGYPLEDPRDGQIYSTVLIGNQCWMAENLNTGTMIQGSEWAHENGILEKYCYNNSEAFCDTYGALYDWLEMMDYDYTTPGTPGICPPVAGWHLPRDEEWCVLEQILDPTITCNSTGLRGTDGGTRLKQGGSSGFEALLGGYRTFLSPYFSGMGTEGRFWTSTMGNDPMYRYVYQSSPKLGRGALNQVYGLSVRCMTYNTNTPPYQPSNPFPSNGATDQSINSNLYWTCSDPEYDILTYDVFLGTSNPPPQVSAGQAAKSYDPGTLSYGTTYYWKIVAYDSHGLSSEGSVWSFSVVPPTGWACDLPFIDARDGQTYQTVLIATQCWMADNLNIGTMIPGAGNMISNGVIEKYCYNDLPGNCDTYGGLYQWNEAMQYSFTPGVQGICPSGWHFPTDTEWCTLEQTVDPGIICDNTSWRGTDGGTKLKQGGSSGFEALMGGGRSTSSPYFGELTTSGSFWTSSQYSSPSASYMRYLSVGQTKVYRSSSTQSGGFSLRCLMNQ